MPAKITIAASFILAAFGAPALAQEVYGGIYAHGVKTPFTLDTGEGGTAVQAGYRFPPIEALRVIGAPQPYAFASIHLSGDTSFAGGGVSWKANVGPVYLRPGIGLVIHDAPSLRVDPETDLRTDLGSRILFAPEIAVGTNLSNRLSIEASWVHISNGRTFNRRQNPGIDTIGVRLNWRL